MVYRLPTQLESFIPPPASQIPIAESPIIRPWRGSFFVSGMRASDIASNQEIQITAVETDGDTQSHLWPSRLIFSITVPHALPILGQFQNFIKTRTPPVSLSTFLPERLRDPNANAVNQTNFRSLSRLLWDSQLVAIVPLPSASSRSPSSPHARGEQREGILIFPASHSSAMLLGAVFMGPHEEFPEFVLAARGATHGHSPSIPTQQTTAYGSASSSRGETSVPISPTVISSQARQYHQHQMTATSPLLSYPSRSHSTQTHTPTQRSSYPHGDRRQSQSVSPISPTDQPAPSHYPPLSASSAERGEQRQSEQANYRYMSPVPMIMSSQARTGYSGSGEYAEGNPYTSTSSSRAHYPASGPSESSTERSTGYTYPPNRGASGNNTHTGYGQ